MYFDQCYERFEIYLSALAQLAFHGKTVEKSALTSEACNEPCAGRIQEVRMRRVRLQTRYDCFNAYEKGCSDGARGLRQVHSKPNGRVIAVHAALTRKRN